MTTDLAMDDGAPWPPPSTVIVRVTADARRLDTWVLGLRARGIPALLHRADGATALHVLPADLAAARAELDALDDEEAEARGDATTAIADAPFHSRLAPLGGVVVAAALVGFYLVTGPSALRSTWFVAGASDAALVTAGQWWRSITALTLHADSNHVLSNVALGAVVVTMVMRRVGTGLGAALVLAAGTIGNLVNAWGYGAQHSSIGFSTAVFGAIGLLGGLTYASAAGASASPRSRRPAWTALAGSVALLALLGASERSDMLAHLFGTCSGVALGLAIGFAGWRPRTWLGQAAAGLASVGAVVGAWAAALALAG